MKIPTSPLRATLAALLGWASLTLSQAQQVVFSEIMYNPEGDLPEYIELLNNTATPYDIVSWKLRGGVDYDFPEFDRSDPEKGFLKAFDRLILSSVSEDALREAYPSIPANVRIYGPWDGEITEEGVRTSGSLSNAGERLTLKDQNDGIMCSVAFDDDPALWPTSPDGAGHSLQVINSDRKIDDWRNWRASSLRGGSPGTADATPLENSLELSEVFFDDAGALAWVEIHNHGSAAASLDGLTFRVPATTVTDEGLVEDTSFEAALSGSVPAGGHVSTAVGFEIDDNNIQILLIDGDRNVLSAHRIEDVDPETAFQRFPAGSQEWYRTSAASQDAANDPGRNDQVVINEIMYSHPVGQIGEFVELYNKGAEAVDVSGWEFTEGISFDFPNGTVIEPEGFLVVAADVVWCQENYETAGTPLGDFEGALSNQGETIRLVDAQGNLADQVEYGSGGEWPWKADEFGSSLELVHPDMDNNLGSAWRDSAESEKGEFREYSVEKKYESRGLWSANSDDELHFHLVGEGYVILKDVNFAKPVSLFNPDSRNLLENADQESIDSKSDTGWVFQGTHHAGFFRDGEVHIISTGRGDNRANRVEIDMEDLGSSTDAELKFEARWVYGKPRLIAQTNDHGWSHEYLIDVPSNLGTPGAPNSVATAAAAPQIDQLHHSPAVPSSDDNVIVSARVSAADGLDSVQVAYIEDGVGGNQESLFRRWSRNPMNDNGTDGDAVAGDGIYSGTISDMKVDGRIVAFFIEATSTAGEEFTFPTGGWESPALYVVDDRNVDFELRTVRAVVGQQDIDRIVNGDRSKHDGKWPRSSNNYWNSTVIYDESEIYYNAVIRSAGSPWHTGDRGNLGLKGKWKMPKSNAFRDRIKTTYDQDPTSGRAHNDRVIRHWLYLLGHKINDNEFIKFAVNDENFNTREEVEPPNGNEFMERNWENGNEGHMYRIDDEWAFSDSLNNRPPNRDADWNYKEPNGHRASRYHSEYMLRSRETEYDYTSLIDSFRLLTETEYTQEDAARYFDIKMIAMNAAARGYIHDWDFQTLNRGKNTFYYQRPDGKFQYIHWDSDLAFRTGDLNAAFKSGRGSTLTRFMNQPWFERWFNYYLNELSENYADGSLRFETWLELEDNSTSDQGCDINRYVSWGERRRSAVNRELGDSRNAAFKVTTNDGNDFSTEEDIISLEGTSAVDAYEVYIEDHPEAEIHWTGTVEYVLSGIILQEGENVLNVRARDERGNVLGSLFSPKKDSITVTKTTPSKPIGDFAFRPASLNVSLGQELEIDASGSWDPEGDALTFGFQAPAGAALSASGPTAEVAFDQPGLYPITITVTDANGNAAEFVREVSVYGGGQGFDDFSERRIESQWREENIEAQSMRFQTSYYTMNDPDGQLSLVMEDDTAKPFADGGAYPAIVRDLPAEADFSLQTKLVLINLQFGPFHTGLTAEITSGDEIQRYAFGIKGGNTLTVSEAFGDSVSDLASIDRNLGRATLRIRRAANQLHFEYREGNEWHSVHSLALAEDAVATQGGLFASSDAALRMRILFDYGMLVDTGQVSSLQRDLRLTEVMYNPAEGEDLEFLEMQNVGVSPLDLTGAHFTDGIEYTFADLQLGAGQFLIVAKDPDAFNAHYGAAAGATIVGGYGGRLSNGGETIELVDASDRLIFTFTYDDEAPWPTEADGGGQSLEIIDTAASLNEASNWQASAAANGSPGTGGDPVEPNPDDTDGDGIPNAWETANGLDPNNAADALADNDSDGSSNLHEYVANTDPNDGSSYQTFGVSQQDGGEIWYAFSLENNRRYHVEMSDDLASGEWQVIDTVEPSDNNSGSAAASQDSNASDSAKRFYRLKVSLP